MSLLVNNIINSSSQISYSYLESDELFGYAIISNYTVKIEDINFDNDDGVLLSGRSAIRAAYKRQNITARIAGDEIHNGLISSLSFDESSLNGSETASFTIEERRRLSSYSSKTFAKYIPNPHLVENFTENYSFSRSDGNYSYSRDISISYSQDAGDQFLNNAKVFLTNYYYENRPSIGYYEDGISENARFDKRFNGRLNESIDLINLTVSLQESFNSSFIESNSVSKIIKEEYSTDQAGYLTKTFVVDLVSLRLDNENVIQQAIKDSIDSITTDQYDEFGDPISIQKGLKKDSSKASITIQFSTNPTNSETNKITYYCEKRKQGSFVEYILNVEYNSRGKNTVDRYNKLMNSWYSAKDDNSNKVISLFSEANGVIYEKTRSVEISKSKSSVVENITYTTNEVYNSSGLPSGILKYDLQLSKTEQIKRTSKVLDIVNLKEKLHVSSYNTIGQATVTATAVASPEYGIFHGKNFLNGKDAAMNAALNESTYYAMSDEISIDLNNGTTTRVIQYVIV